MELKNSQMEITTKVNIRKVNLKGRENIVGLMVHLMRAIFYRVVDMVKEVGNHPGKAAIYI